MEGLIFVGGVTRHLTSVCTLQICSSPSQYRSQVWENLSVLPSLVLLSSESMYHLFPCQKHYSEDLCSPGCDSQSSSGILVEIWQRWLSQCLGRCHHSGKLSKLKYDLYRSWSWQNNTNTSIPHISSGHF